jgi:hypothetical protein
LSKVHESAIVPWRETRPNVGRSPLTPQNVDGHTIDPHVSDPIAKPASAADTAAPAPEEEPHVQRPVSHGLRAAPVSEAAGIV